MTAINKSVNKFLILSLFLIPIVAIAAIVTAAQVTQAVLNSPNASAALKQYATSIGKLALNVEDTTGDTTKYNGSCCYGILQMNQANINSATKGQLTPAQFAQLSLQDQVNAWSTVMSQAMNSSVVKQLKNMGAFDGRTVDGDLVLACIQLGPGNCQTAINSGSCGGFSDKNGTTICSMADKIETGTSSNSGSSSSSSGNTGNSSGSSSPSQLDLSCVKDENGNCLDTDEAVKQGFESGSGMDMSALKTLIKGGVLSIIIPILTINIGDTFTLYTKGVIHQHVLLRVAVQNLISIALMISPS